MSKETLDVPDINSHLKQAVPKFEIADGATTAAKMEAYGCGKGRRKVILFRTSFYFTKKRVRTPRLDPNSQTEL